MDGVHLSRANWHYPNTKIITKPATSSSKLSDGLDGSLTNIFPPILAPDSPLHQSRCSRTVPVELEGALSELCNDFSSLETMIFRKRRLFESSRVLSDGLIARKIL